ncbi:uncharacterized protein LOC123561133 [Mercenaria mercenaria]|uniref:uncharacterized protein LOC123561133 n=1 Tax=Mercenaria mercenaria TaxID=6596 RepID=UPI00234E9464|nr:uncharacterized protein LOC123561133 [Mercenaria mercenaria]
MSSSVEDVEFKPYEREAVEAEENVRSENVQLLIDIAHLCNRKDRTRVENIFLLGKSGAGKSALVNTVIKVIAGKYLPKAKVGAGVTQSKTLTLERYKSCGVTREDLTVGTQRDLVQGMLRKLPTILDAAGKGDINTESLREILELLIGGYIPPGTSIEALENLQKEYRVGALKDIIYTQPQEDWKVTKVVFVQSCRDAVPQNLVECLHTVLKTTDPKTAQPLYTGDVFVVITKYDLVKDQSKYDSPSSEQTVTMEEFESVENTVAEVFNIKGALNDNRIRWVSYTDMVDTDNPYIDNIALKFIKRMVTPGNQREEVVKPVITQSTKMMLEARKWWQDQTFSLSQVLLIIVSLFVALLLYKLFTAPL